MVKSFIEKVLDCCAKYKSAHVQDLAKHVSITASIESVFNYNDSILSGFAMLSSHKGFKDDFALHCRIEIQKSHHVTEFVLFRDSLLTKSFLEALVEKYKKADFSKKKVSNLAKRKTKKTADTVTVNNINASPIVPVESLSAEIVEIETSVDVSPVLSENQLNLPRKRKHFENLAKSQKNKRTAVVISCTDRCFANDDNNGKIINTQRVLQHYINLANEEENADNSVVTNNVSDDNDDYYLKMKTNWSYSDYDKKRVLSFFRAADDGHEEDAEIIIPKLKKLQARYPYWGGLSLAKVLEWRLATRKPKKKMG